MGSRARIRAGGVGDPRKDTMSPVWKLALRILAVSMAWVVAAAGVVTLILVQQAPAPVRPEIFPHIAAQEAGLEAAALVPALQEALTQLEHFGIVLREGGRLRIAAGLFQRWVAQGDSA
jgi:hypothetical protein